jgi:hypothetical protein
VISLLAMRAVVFAAVALALGGPAVAAEAAGRTYVRNPLTNKLAQRPHTINFRDADLTSLKWTHWGWSRAIAHGKASVLVCTPNCAAGHRERGTVRLVLSRKQTENGKRVYQCIRGTISGVAPPNNRISWQC